MTVKALKTQLMAAIAMTLVAAVALGSSTFAWFASNTKVTATGMQVQAVAEDGLEIAAKSGNTAPENSAYSTTATASDNYLAKLYPTSTVNTTTWFHAAAATASASAAKAGTYEQLSLSAGNESSTVAGSDSEKQKPTQYYDNAGRQYYLLNTFVIRTVNGGGAKDVKVSGLTVTGTPVALDQSLRVALVSGEQKLFYKPSLTSDTTLNAVSAISGSNDSQTATKDTTTALLAPATSDGMDDFLTGVNAEGKEVSIFVYYEGEDTEHYSNNLTGAKQTLNVTVEFTGVDAT